MKKKLLSLTAAFLTTVAVSSAFAQAPKCDNQCCDKAKCEQRCDKKDKRACVFDSMNLTDAQKAQLKALNEKQREQCKARKQENKQRDRRQAVESKKQYLEEVKAIVGPENYVVFLENMVVNQPGHHGDKGKFDKCQRGKNGDMKFDRKDKRAEGRMQFKAGQGKEKAKDQQKSK